MNKDKEVWTLVRRRCKTEHWKMYLYGSRVVSLPKSTVVWSCGRIRSFVRLHESGPDPPLQYQNPVSYVRQVTEVDDEPTCESRMSVIELES